MKYDLTASLSRLCNANALLSGGMLLSGGTLLSLLLSLLSGGTLLVLNEFRLLGSNSLERVATGIYSFIYFHGQFGARVW